MFNLVIHPLSYDETCSIAEASKNFSGFSGYLLTFKYRILYPLFLKGWTGVFDSKEYPTRMLSVIFGVFSIFFIYKLAKALFNHRVAIWSAFLLSFSVFHIYYSRQVRHYSLFSLLTIVSFYLFVHLLATGKRRFFFFNIIANFLLINTYPFGLLIVLAQYLVLFYVFFVCKVIPKPTVIKWIFVQSLAAFIYLVIFFIPSLNYVSDKMQWIHKPRFFTLVDIFLTFMFGGRSYGSDLYNIPIAYLILPVLLSVPFFYLFLSGTYKAFLSKKESSSSSSNRLSDAIMLSWFFFPLLISYLLSCFKPLLVTKYLICLLPAFLILVASGIELVKNISLRIILIASVLACSFVSLGGLYRNDHTDNWYEVASYIREKSKPDESIIICSRREIVPFIYYFDYNNRHKLDAMDIYGKWANGKWEDVFEYNKEIIVGIEELTTYGYLNPFKSFMSKYNENKLSWHDKNLWLIISKSGQLSLRDFWPSIGKSGEITSFKAIIENLSKTHTKIVEKEFGGCIFSYWEKHN